MKTIADLQDDIRHYRMCKALGASRTDDLKDEINTTLLNLQKLYMSKHRQELSTRVSILYQEFQSIV